MTATGNDRVLVAGIGNVFFGDDGFGVEAVRRVDPATVPDGVTVADYGIRGVHLAYDLLDGGYQTLLLVDAVARGDAPGTVSLIEVADVPPGPVLDSHAMTPEAVLGVVSSLGGQVGRVLVIGCEPATTEPGIGLSPPVAAAVPVAVELINSVASAEREAAWTPSKC